jgi:hypothetical protein
MTWVSIGIAAVGAVVTISGQQQQKKAAQGDAAFEAQQLEQAAGRDRATGQRRAEEERRQARLVQSALQARAGGGGLDPTVMNLAADIAGEGEYRALAALYEGEESARGKEESAAAARRTGRARGRAMDYASASTLLSTGSSIYSKYKA